MKYNQDLNESQLLGKSEELIYQIKQVKYHLENVRECLREATHQLQRSSYHARLANEEVIKIKKLKTPSHY